MRVLSFLLALLPVIATAQDFPDSLSWKIEFQGLNDAKTPKFRDDKTVEGRHDFLVGNTNQLVTINKLISEKVKKFDPEENVSAKMTFATTNVLLYDTMPAGKVKKFFGQHSILLSNCEMFNYFPSMWVNPFEGNDQLGVVAEIDQTTPPVQGDGSLRMKGKNYPNKHYACSLTRVLNFSDMTTANLILPKIDSANLWFLLDVYGRGDSDGVFTLMVRERGTDAIYNPISFDYYRCDIPLNFKGWKQIAVCYSDMTSTVFLNMNTGRTLGTMGDRRKNSLHIQEILYILSSKTDGKAVEVNIDNLMILYNKNDN